MWKSYENWLTFGELGTKVKRPYLIYIMASDSFEPPCIKIQCNTWPYYWMWQRKRLQSEIITLRQDRHEYFITATIMVIVRATGYKLLQTIILNKYLLCLLSSQTKNLDRINPTDDCIPSAYHHHISHPKTPVNVKSFNTLSQQARAIIYTYTCTPAVKLSHSVSTHKLLLSITVIN